MEGVIIMSLSSSEQNIHIFQHHIIKQYIYSMGFAELKRFFNGETIIPDLIFREAQKSFAEELSLSSFSLEKNTAATSISGKATVVYKFPSVNFSSGCRYIFFIELEHDLPMFLTVEKEEEDKELHLYEWLSSEEKKDHGIVEEGYYSVRSKIFVSVLGNTNSDDEASDKDIFFKTEAPKPRILPIGSINPPNLDVVKPYPEIYINNTTTPNSSTSFPQTSSSLYALSNSEKSSKPNKSYKGFFKFIGFVLFVMTIVGLFAGLRGLWISGLILFIIDLIIIKKGDKILKSKLAVFGSVLIPIILVLVFTIPNNTPENTSGYEKVTLSSSNFEEYFNIDSSYSFTHSYWGNDYVDLSIDIVPDSSDYGASSYSSSSITVKIKYYFSEYSQSYYYTSYETVTITLNKSSDYYYSGSKTLYCDEDDNYLSYEITSVSGTIYI